MESGHLVGKARSRQPKSPVHCMSLLYAPGSPQRSLSQRERTLKKLELERRTDREEELVSLGYEAEKQDAIQQTMFTIRRRDMKAVHVIPLQYQNFMIRSYDEYDRDEVLELLSESVDEALPLSYRDCVRHRFLSRKRWRFHLILFMLAHAATAVLLCYLLHLIVPSFEHIGDQSHSGNNILSTESTVTSGHSFPAAQRHHLPRFIRTHRTESIVSVVVFLACACWSVYLSIIRAGYLQHSLREKQIMHPKFLKDIELRRGFLEHAVTLVAVDRDSLKIAGILSLFPAQHNKLILFFAHTEPSLRRKEQEQEQRSGQSDEHKNSSLRNRNKDCERAARPRKTAQASLSSVMLQHGIRLAKLQPLVHSRANDAGDGDDHCCGREGGCPSHARGGQGGHTKNNSNSSGVAEKSACATAAGYSEADYRFRAHRLSSSVSSSISSSVSSSSSSLSTSPPPSSLDWSLVWDCEHYNRIAHSFARAQRMELQESPGNALIATRLGCLHAEEIEVWRYTKQV